MGWASGAFKVSVNHAETSYVAGNVSSDTIALGYNATLVRLMGGVFRDRVAATVNNTGRGFTIGGVIPVGAGDIKMAFSRYGTNANTGLQPETRKVAVGYVHNLAKRTALYTTYARVHNRDGANRALNGAATAPNAGSSGFDLGIRHNF